MSDVLTPGQEARLTGLLALFEADGRTITTDGGETFVGLIEDIQPLLEPVEIARQKLPVIVNVTALKGAVQDPRVVKTMTEPQYGDMKVLKYIETRADQLTWKWTCEAQRQ